MLRLPLPLILVLAALLGAGAQADSYVVSPQATAETKAAVAEGRPPLHGYPEIREVQFTTPSQLHPGASINANVETSANVYYVEGRVKYWNVAFHQVAPGKFVLAYRVPMLPPEALGHWDLQVVARTLDGVEVRRSFPFTYRYF